MKALTALVVVLVLAAAAAATWLYIGVERPYRGYASEEQFVDIP
jgi:hypothetical protein